MKKDENAFPQCLSVCFQALSDSSSENMAASTRKNAMVSDGRLQIFS